MAETVISGKVAIVINQDSEDRHLQNVEQSVVALEQQGYQTIVISPEKPQQEVDVFYDADDVNLDTILQKYQEKIGQDTDLVVYMTGHGNEASGPKLADSIDHLKYQKRTVITDQCFGGSLAKYFVNDPKTLFISAGGNYEKVCCEEFAPRFWAKDVKDINGDGGIDWQERYANVQPKDVKKSNPNFTLTQGYQLSGKPSFSSNVVDINTSEELDQKLKNLQPGQFAVVMFSMEPCPACDKFKPQLDEIAKQAGGQLLFLHTKNDELGGKYGVQKYPTLVVFNGEGQHFVVNNYLKLWDEFPNLVPNLDDRFNRILSHVLKPTTEIERAHQFIMILSMLEGVPSEQAKSYYDKLVLIAEQMQDPHAKILTLGKIGEYLSKRGELDQSKQVYDKLIQHLQTIQNTEALEYVLSSAVQSIDNSQLDQQDKMLYVKAIFNQFKQISDPLVKANAALKIAGIFLSTNPEQAQVFIEIALDLGVKFIPDKQKIDFLIKIMVFYLMNRSNLPSEIYAQMMIPIVATIQNPNNLKDILTMFFQELIQNKEELSEEQVSKLEPILQQKITDESSRAKLQELLNQLKPH